MMSLFSHINEIVPLLFFLTLLYIFLPTPHHRLLTILLGFILHVCPIFLFFCSKFCFFRWCLFLSIIIIFFFRLELYSYILSFPLSSPIIPVRMKNNGRCHRVVKVSLRPPTHLCVCVPISPLASSRRAQYKYKANQNKYLYRFNN